MTTSRMQRALLFLAALVAGPLGLGSGKTEAAPPPPDPQYHTTGWWEGAYDWGIAGIHSVLLHGAGDSHSQVLVFNTGNEGLVWKFNPLDALAPGDLTEVSTDNSNIFCAGHSVMKDGRALITGGNEFSDQGTDHVNIYDPMSNPSGYQSPRPRNMFEGRYYPTNTTMSDGTVLVNGGRKFQQMVNFGGGSGAGPGNTTFALGLRGKPQYIPVAPSGTLPVGRTGHSACFDSLRNDQTPVAYRYKRRIVIFGGRDANGNYLSDVHVVNRDELEDWTWDTLNPDPDPAWGAPAPRMNHVAALDPADSSLIIHGGLNGSGPLDDVWKLHLYRGAEGRWTRLFPTGGDPTLARHGHTGVYDVAGDRLIIFGGRSGAGVFNDVVQLTFGPSPAWTWVTTSGPTPPARELHVAFRDLVWPRNRMLVYGGQDAAGDPLGDIWQLDLASAPAWSVFTADDDPTYGTPGPRSRPAAAHDQLHDRWILYGGDTNGSDPDGEVGDLWDLKLSNPTGGGSHGHKPAFSPADFVPHWTRQYDNLTGQNVAGHSLVLDTRWLNSALPELFYPEFDFWQPLYSARKWMQLYPFMFLLPDGLVFYSGPVFVGELLDVNQGTWLPNLYFTPFLGGSAVQYLPGKIMKCGEQGVIGLSNASVIDFTAGPNSAAWTSTGLVSPMSPRVEHNLTLLPTGEVLLSGGLSNRLQIATADRRPQIWNPVTGQFTPAGQLALDPKNRDYHSTALLLPDGRILSTGGEIKSHPEDRSRLTATIYWPPYLFDENGNLAPRPQITAVPGQLAYGNTFILSTPEAASISSVALLRPGSVTHAFNQEQRYVPLEFDWSGQGNWLRVTAPPDGNTAPPGWYLLFIVDQDAVPSIASWVEIGTTVTGTPDVARAVAPSAYPNPVAAATRIEFGLASAQMVEVTLFDAAGRLVRTLAKGEFAAGPHAIPWDVRNDRGETVANGIYLARIDLGSTRKTLKLVVRR